MKTSNNATTFLVGITLGVFGGFLVGAFFGKSVFQLASILLQLVSREGKQGNKRINLELLLQ